MFDIGFSELALIFLIGLVVLGPKRLPIAIRTVMGWVSTLRGLAANVQNELAQELKLQELQESIKKAEQLNLSKLSPELAQTVSELKQSAEKMQQDLQSGKAEIARLSQEQVAEIQQRIEQENDTSMVTVASEKNWQNRDVSPPLVDTNEGEQPLSDDIAELAEADEEQLEESLEEKLSMYYPPDDEMADPSSPQGKQNVS